MYINAYIKICSSYKVNVSFYKTWIKPVSKLEIMIALKKLMDLLLLFFFKCVWQYTVCGCFANGIEND